jgi:hypothetical protein
MYVPKYLSHLSPRYSSCKLATSLHACVWRFLWSAHSINSCNLFVSHRHVLPFPHPTEMAVDLHVQKDSLLSLYSPNNEAMFYARRLHLVCKKKSKRMLPLTLVVSKSSQIFFVIKRTPQNNSP